MQKRKNGWGRRAAGVVGVFAIAASLLVGGQLASTPAQAAELPTWDDVQAAKQNQATAAKKVTEIEGLIAAGEKELERLRNLHSTKVAELNQAEENLAAAAAKAETLNTQAVESRKQAEDAADRAGVLVAQMYRSGGVDRSMELFLDADADTADALLERLASMSKATERNTQLSEEAEQAANTADTLSKQAKAAEDEREALRADVKAKEEAAAAAMVGQGEKVQAQEKQQTELSAQLAALKDTTAKTVDGYEQRLREEEARRKAEQERLRKQAEEYARQQAELLRQQQEAAENANNNGGGGDDGGGGDPGNPVDPGTGDPGNGGVSNGWVIPTAYSYVSEGFAPPGRPDHTGIDLAAGCYTPIVAAAAGTVRATYMEWGAGGNMVTINHPSGWQTRYAHMAEWASVAPGQWVEAGQFIGYVGSTGASSGCHLHFEMRLNQDDGWYGFVNPAWYINF
ncbi:peptidoglycan DD-metalloendopeptidase family protein [Leucobacter luti]|uniref:peptidoglycan DD-metalloendopeptidase family protein n=1 Tax=Leucobacter luti TaxID=340320 RepID=UPI001050F0DE|nr:peptidoglycan DD-metalloendopeptidase family protein [Leucobacter luti]MCW2287153.1 murein DD-endopeptidase MepM/ murein hydrolase activator NlpD [Leucobacter luti]